MKEPNSDWYKSIWSLDIKNMSWVEDTNRQVDFLIEKMKLNGSERILDLACGFGRHSIALAQRGFDVVGVDITKEFIEDAKMTARNMNLKIEFSCGDIRNVICHGEFDVVLNLADGAIGYLEDENENLKIFDIIAASLKPGGKHLMDICNGEHAEMYFPKRHWETGAKSISLSEFSWNKETKRMLYGGYDIPLGKIAQAPKTIEPDSSIRLYNKNELRQILSDRDMTIIETYSDFNGTPDSAKEMQLMAYSRKGFAMKI